MRGIWCVVHETLRTTHYEDFVLMKRIGFISAVLILTSLLTACSSSFGPFEPLFVTVTPNPAGQAQAQVSATPAPAATDTAIVVDGEDSPESADPTGEPTSEPTEDASPTPEPARETITYEIQAGDTLIAIAGQFDVSVEAIMAENGIEDANNIWAGQEITIPGAAVQAGDASEESVSTGDPANTEQSEEQTDESTADLPDSAEVSQEQLPDQVYLDAISHDWQKLNNCGPTTVAMALSYFGEALTQFDTASVLKGSEQDKNVAPEDLVRYLNSRGYPTRIFINGDMETLRRLVANDIPVISEQWLIREGDPLTGHYRLVRGYNDNEGVFIVNDSYLGPNLRFTYSEFDRRWRGFNRLYIPVFTPQQEPLVREIIGAEWNEQQMYENALTTLQDEVRSVGDLYAHFNIGDVYLRLGRYEDAVAAYEQAMSFGLPERMLWYRFGPYEAYNATGQYQKTVNLANAQIAAVSALEEVHYYRGKAYQGLGQMEQARADFQAAVDYNARYQPAQDALASLQ